MVEISSILEVEKYIKDLDAIIFDLDDTLYSEKQYIKSGYRKIAKYFGKPEMEDEMWAVFEARGKAIDEVLGKYDLMTQKDTALHIYRFQEPEINLYPGVARMIRKIHSEKKVGIITDGRPEGQRAKIKALNLDVDKVIITDELGGIQYRKPNPKAFELMLERFQVWPEKACYVGDNTEKDFIIPESFRMKCLWFNNPDGLYT